MKSVFAKTFVVATCSLISFFTMQPDRASAEDASAMTLPFWDKVGQFGMFPAYKEALVAIHQAEQFAFPMTAMPKGSVLDVQMAGFRVYHDGWDETGLKCDPADFAADISSPYLLEQVESVFAKAGYDIYGYILSRCADDPEATSQPAKSVVIRVHHFGQYVGDIELRLPESESTFVAAKKGEWITVDVPDAPVEKYAALLDRFWKAETEGRKGDDELQRALNDAASSNADIAEASLSYSSSEYAISNVNFQKRFNPKLLSVAALLGSPWAQYQAYFSANKAMDQSASPASAEDDGRPEMQQHIGYYLENLSQNLYASKYAPFLIWKLERTDDMPARIAEIAEASSGAWKSGEALFASAGGSDTPAKDPVITAMNKYLADDCSRYHQIFPEYQGRRDLLRGAQMNEQGKAVAEILWDGEFQSWASPGGCALVTRSTVLYLSIGDVDNLTCGPLSGDEISCTFDAIVPCPYQGNAVINAVAPGVCAEWRIGTTISVTKTFKKMEGYANWRVNE